MLSKKLLHTFFRYFSVGIFNTLVHWGIFYLVFSFYAVQSIANIVAFSVAVLVSYILNALYTFKKDMAGKKFILFTAFMGLMSFTTGFVADSFSLHPLFTLVFSSGFSLVAGFLFSNYVVFKDA